ncbi:mitochondrial inner membrane protein OXA1-like isoform X1 [Magnolia sinica]|uniref:mitochondrial inner membrane protein OXA1-like isoform X1 n=1 Tax=Magnolia sinica TaxID=86752 RepID=UPI00265A7A1A|nr:mitochondrial inner membrane protein OXA1-like isoform X1 [Magnolia sinica]
MYRRSISSKFTLLTRRCHPSFTHLLLHDDNDKIHSGPVADPSQTQNGNFLQREFHRNYNHATAGLGALFRERRGFASSLPLGLGPSFCSYSSSTIGDGSDKVEYMSDVASVFTEKSMEVAVVQATVASEVAVAAADSFLPVAFLQYFIDGVHNVTGLNWWAAIALTTLMIRCATAPLLINQLKATSKLTQMRPHMEEIKQQMEDSMDPKAAAEGQKRMMALFQEYGVTPFTPLKGLFIQGPVFISFYLAVTNMVEKVPSFKGGGAFWFSDLTTPDTLYIFPVLTALSFLLTVELNMQEGLEGNPVAGTMKKFSRIFAVLTVPFTMSFPKAIFCYWITSNLFSLVYGLVIKRPSVKKLLGLPEIVPQPTTAQQPSFYPFGGSKPLLGGLKSLFGESVSATTADPLTPVNQSKIPDTRISRSSNVGQRFSRLERTVKGRKRTKKN